ncbi:hypothetical protein AVEN_148849-1 [Araneus ventricosus]|uniref:Uncharacterized protein n=1 Tax=Araneus ventricosus TaxID=182803 RepID=A0A4Y2MEU3_ARAVE|nr:hypothetical protein AVEN_148849-1 [Araneus ventricosus]
MTPSLEGLHILFLKFPNRLLLYSDINNLPELNSSTPPQSRIDFDCFIKTFVVSVLNLLTSSVLWLLTIKMISRHLVLRREHGSSSNSCRRGSGVLAAVRKYFSPCVWTF